VALVPDRLADALEERYLLERELGQGGMATVYLAQDRRHDRRVAVKVLRPELAAIIGAERFLAEIKTTANLQHPHILPLHDSGEAGPFLYYVMPYVEGESLRARLAREKQLPVGDALAIASEVGAALDYAHRQGVIHRDIKPENILLQDGHALVADFGIALAVSRAGTTRLTETGLSLGTPQYMSPEQATGERDLSARSDVYALGAVVYEMLTGEPPFSGPTAQAIAAKVLTETPVAVRVRRRLVPEPVEAAVMAALEKLPADRPASAGEFVRALQGEALPSTVRVRRLAPRAAASLWRHPGLGWLVGALAVGGVAWAALQRPHGPAPAVVRFKVELPPPAQLSKVSPAPVFSPDGRYLAIPAELRGDKRLYLLDLSTGEPRLVPGTEDGGSPAFSSDGRWLAFRSGEKLKKVLVSGGTPIDVANTRTSGLGVAWGAPGIVYNPKYGLGLWRISAEGGQPDTVTVPEPGELGHWWPQILPDGETVVFTAYRNTLESSSVEAVSLRTGRRTRLVTGGVYGRFVEPDLLMYYQGGNLVTTGFDPRTLRVSAPASPVVQNMAFDRLTAQPAYAVAPNGALAWVADSQYRAVRQLVWLDRAGQESAAVPETAIYGAARLSPDGRKVALTIEEGSDDIWIINLMSGARTRLTREPTIESRPVWSPDGRWIYYQAEHGSFDLYVHPAEPGDTAAVLASSRYDKYPFSVTPDGSALLSVEDEISERLIATPLDGSGPSRVLAQGSYNLESPMMSPNGQWVVYASNESGSFQILAARYGAHLSEPRELTRSGITSSLNFPWLRWASSGSEIVYLKGDSLMSLAFDPRTGSGGTPHLLFRTQYEPADVSPDGRRFLAIKTPPETAPRRVAVVLNWRQTLSSADNAR